MGEMYVNIHIHAFRFDSVCFFCLMNESNGANENIIYHRLEYMVIVRIPPHITYIRVYIANFSLASELQIVFLEVKNISKISIFKHFILSQFFVISSAFTSENTEKKQFKTELISFFCCQHQNQPIQLDHFQSNLLHIVIYLNQ